MIDERSPALRLSDAIGFFSPPPAIGDVRCPARAISSSLSLPCGGVVFPPVERNVERIKVMWIVDRSPFRSFFSFKGSRGHSILGRARFILFSFRANGRSSHFFPSLNPVS